jgi:hypothetical protein
VARELVLRMDKGWTGIKFATSVKGERKGDAELVVKAVANLMEKRLGPFLGRVGSRGEDLGGDGPGVVADERNGLGVSSEGPDVVTDPGERQRDVLETVVAGRDVVSGAEETCGHAGGGPGPGVSVRHIRVTPSRRPTLPPTQNAGESHWGPALAKRARAKFTLSDRKCGGASLRLPRVRTSSGPRRKGL